MNVDFEERVDFARLRQYRLDRAKAAMEAAGLGALLVFDNNNIRYLTGVAIGEWTRDKLCRYALFTRTGELVLWDFGSAAVHHRLFCPWLKPENCIASYTTMRGAAPPASGLTAKQVAEIKDRLTAAGVAGEPVGVDFAEVPTFFELQKENIDIRDGQQVMLDARQVKSKDEITLLATAAAMVDGTYTDIAEALRPGVKENEIVALANKRLYEMGSTTWSRSTRSRASAATRTRTTSRPHDQAGRAGVLRHHAFLQRLPDLLLPLLRGRPGQPAAKGRLQKSPRVDRRRYRDDQARGVHRPGSPAVADRAGDRSGGRDGVRPAVRARSRARAARAADHLPAHLAGRPDGDRRGHGLRARDYCPATDGRSAAASRKKWWSGPAGSRS